MRYLNKIAESQVILQGLQYSSRADRSNIRALLLVEQRNFCAYSERYFLKTDESHIEHFDPRLKDTITDSYFNWYATHPWMNSHKPKKIDDYLPILIPGLINLGERVEYQSGFFVATNEADIEAKNLIDYLGFNKYELTIDRSNHVKMIAKIKEICGDDHEMFNELFTSHPSNFSFATALLQDLGIEINNYLE